MHPAYGLILIIIILALLTVIVAEAYAFDYFKSMEFLWTGEGSPVVCFPDGLKENKHTTIRALKQWSIWSKNYDNSVWFNYKIKQGIDENCNIEVLLDNPNNYGADQSKLAIADCYQELNYCRIIINYDEYPTYYHDTLVHEMGHVLGLGHRMPYNTTDAPFVLLSNDIMIPKAAHGMVITTEALDALNYMYEYYEQFNNFTDYAIPHPSMNIILSTNASIE